MIFHATGTREGKLELSDYSRARFKEFLRENGPIRMTITPDLPESGKLRRWYEGGLVPLVVFYQEGMDHRDGEDRRKVREWLKEEFNGEFVTVAGKAHRVAKTTKGRAVLGPFVERVLSWLVVNYDPPQEALDPEEFKRWRDTIYPSGGPDTYIGYLAERGIIRISKTV